MVEVELFAKPDYKAQVERRDCFSVVLVALVVLLLLDLITLSCVCASGSRDPDTGRIKVLFIGERSGVTPYNMLQSDPLMDPNPVIASTTLYSINIITRSIRLYMPRSFEILTSYQVVILSDTNAAIFFGQAPGLDPGCGEE